MASSTLFSLCVAVYLLSFFFTTSFSVISTERVKLDLYYEPLFPACSNFIGKELPKIFKNGLIKIVDLNLVPYGNAILENGTITCQHGGDGCKLNMVEACAIQTWPNVYKHYTFIFCVEKLVMNGRYTEWESCYDDKNFDFYQKPITDCTNNSMGKQLALKYANETESLKPPHHFLPWVVVNNEPLRENFPKFMTYICKAYHGTPPEACKNIFSPGPRVEEQRTVNDDLLLSHILVSFCAVIVKHWFFFLVLVYILKDVDFFTFFFVFLFVLFFWI